MSCARPAGWRQVACLLTIALLPVSLSACGETGSAADGSVSPAAVSPDPASPPVVRQVPMRVRAEFALFRSLPEGMPSAVTQALAASSPYGVNWQLAQSLPGAPWPAWIAPGRGHLCLAQQETPRSGIGLACALTREVLEEGVFITTISADSEGSKPSHRAVIGVVPDGARAVRVHTPRSAPAFSTVRQNVFALRDRTLDPPEAITLIR